jgi:zinc transport system ATP-binding protein
VTNLQLEANNLVLGYDGKTVTENISFSVNAGDYLCIIGENGVGKSTLLKAILGLNKLISGSVKLYIHRKEIGYLPQQDNIQKDFPASVKEIVLSGCLNRSRFRPFYTKEEREIVRKSMEAVNILDLTKKCYRELSGGQQQRVLLARALAAARKMIVLDEPVAGLDPSATADFYRVIKEKNANGEITVIMISHDVETVINFASHILYIGKEKVFFGTTYEYGRVMEKI